MLKIAWIVQIIITLSVDVLSASHYKNFDVSIGLFILIFGVWSVATLCKIPLLIAAYYSSKIIWRVILSVAFVLIIISEFETILTTLEVNHQLMNLEIWSYIAISAILASASPLIAFIGIRYLDKSK